MNETDWNFDWNRLYSTENWWLLLLHVYSISYHTQAVESHGSSRSHLFHFINPWARLSKTCSFILYTFFRAACSVLSADSICLQVCLISGHRFLLAIFLVTIDNKQQFESEEFSGLGPERQANLLKRSQMISVWLWIEDVSNLWLHCWQLRSESWWRFMT